MNHKSDDTRELEQAAHALPARTTPTWEVELLISGVAVFAMLQLPGLFDDALFAIWPRFDPAWHDPIRLLYVYLKGAAVILAATFAVHLMLRAHWIALVGMHSIYPEGVRWDGLRMGPIQREYEQGRASRPDDVIDRADNRATTVFALGVMMATLLLSVSVLVAGVFALGTVAIRLSGISVNASNLLLGCVLLAVLPVVVLTLVDRRIGARLPDGGLARRVIRAGFRCYGVFGMRRGNNVLAMLASHGGERRTMLLVFACFMPVLLAVMFGSRAMQSPERLGSYGMFPDPSALPGHALAAVHYDRLRDPSRDPAVPYIEDPVVVGPYLRLTVPFIPGRDDRAMRAACADAAANEALRSLQCLQRVHAASIDGKPVADLRYDAGTDARTERPALVAMIDVRGLARGRHELRVGRAAPDADEDRDWRIAFWR